MSAKALLLSTAVTLAVTAPAFADSGTVFLNNVQGRVPHATPSQDARAEVVAELRQAQQKSNIQYYQVGEGSSYPPASAAPSSGKAMTHRGADMPGGQGMMPDHPHRPMTRGSDKPMTHQGNNMPGGQGMMPDHPHQGQRR